MGVRASLVGLEVVVVGGGGVGEVMTTSVTGEPLCSTHLPTFIHSSIYSQGFC